MTERKTIYLDDAMLKIAKVDKNKYADMSDFHDACVDCLKNLPSAQPEITNAEIRFALKQLEAYFSIKIRDKKEGDVPVELLQRIEEIQEYVDNLPSAQPERDIPLDCITDEGGNAICPKCGANAEWHKYCRECGQALRWKE